MYHFIAANQCDICPRNLVALESGLNSVNACSIPNGLIYAQELLKLGSLDDDDVEAWLAFNWQSYPYRFVHDSLTQVINSDSGKKRRFREILAGLDALYGVPPDDSSTRLSSMEHKFSNMMRGFSKNAPEISSSLGLAAKTTLPTDSSSASTS
jgi:hypothetical protein